MSNNFKPADAKMFSRVVRDRRQELGLTLAAVAAAGGPAEPTMVRIESGEGAPIRVSTLAKLDGILRWRKGSALAALDGAEPNPLEDNQYEVNNGATGVAIRAVEVVELSELVGEFNRLLPVPEEPAKQSMFSDCVRRLEDLLEPIMVRAAQTRLSAEPEDVELINQALANWVILRGASRRT